MVVVLTVVLDMAVRPSGSSPLNRPGLPLVDLSALFTLRVESILDVGRVRWILITTFVYISGRR